MLDLNKIMTDVRGEMARLGAVLAAMELANENRVVADDAPLPKNGRKRVLSQAARDRIGAAQRVRWAKVKAVAGRNTGRRRKRKLSTAGRRRISEAQKARWARVRNISNHSKKKSIKAREPVTAAA